MHVQTFRVKCHSTSFVRGYRPGGARTIPQPYACLKSKRNIPIQARCAHISYEMHAAFIRSAVQPEPIVCSARATAHSIVKVQETSPSTECWRRHTNAATLCSSLERPLAPLKFCETQALMHQHGYERPRQPTDARTEDTSGLPCSCVTCTPVAAHSQSWLTNV